MHFILLAAATLLLPFSATAGVMEVRNPWVRASLVESEISAGYIEIINGTAEDDALIAAESPVAGVVEIHTMRMNGGIMQMRKIEKVDIESGKTVSLSPGGDHLMFLQLKETLKKGSTIPLTLTFEHAGKVEVQATVRSMDEMPASSTQH